MLPAAGVVFALDGVLIGAGDVAFLRNITIVAGVFAFAPLNLAALHWHWGIGGVWAGLTAFILVRLVGMLWRTRGERWVVLGVEPAATVRLGRVPTPPTDGLVIVDKPAGLTSHDVVGPDAPARAAPARSATPARSTRWPPACSCSASAGPPGCSPTSSWPTRPTRRRSGSGRRRSPTTPRARSRSCASAAAVTEADVRAAMAPLRGEIEQVPSAVSAIKVDGERSYQRVRDGRDRRACRAPGHGDAGSRRPAFAPRRRPARRRRRGGVLVGHLRPRAGPRPRRRARRRRPPHRAAPHPRRPVRPRARPARSTSSPPLDDPVALPLAAAVRVRAAGARGRRRRGPRAVLRPADRRRRHRRRATARSPPTARRSRCCATTVTGRVRCSSSPPPGRHRAMARDGLDDVRALLAGRLPDVRLSVDRDLGGSDRSRVSRVRARFPDGAGQLRDRQAVPHRGRGLGARGRRALGAADDAPVPRLIAEGAAPPLIVVTDLGEGPAVSDALLGADPDAAADGRARVGRGDGSPAPQRPGPPRPVPRRAGAARGRPAGGRPRHADGRRRGGAAARTPVRRAGRALRRAAPTASSAGSRASSARTTTPRSARPTPARTTTCRRPPG